MTTFEVLTVYVQLTEAVNRAHEELTQLPTTPRVGDSDKRLAVIRDLGKAITAKAQRLLNNNLTLDPNTINVQSEMINEPDVLHLLASKKGTN